MTPEQIKEMVGRLKEPFPPDAVSWRVGSTNSEKTSGLALAYIDARDVMNRLDEVCGAENWQDDYKAINGTVLCTISIRVGEGGDWVAKTDGAGVTDVEAEKGQISDAFKRCAVKWGVGRYLYDLDSPWVKITQRGRSYVIDTQEYGKLRAVLTKKPAGPERALAAPMKDAAGQMGEDFDQTQMGKPSKQATEIGNLLVSCKTEAELDAEVAKQKKVVSALHKTDKTYLNQIASDQRRYLKAPAASKELVP